MRKLLTAGIFGTILGIVSTGTANASIVSSGFLDEKLTEMTNATTLQLDNKANQSDLTALSNKIGTLPSAILPSGWTAIPYYSENNVNMTDAGFPLPPTLGEQLEFLFNGGPESPIERMFWTITMRGGNIETNDNPDTYFLGLNPLTQKIRSIQENIRLPDRLTVANLYDGWTDKNDGTTYLGLKDINTKIGTLPTEYATVGAALTAIKGIAEDAKAAALAAIPDPKQEGSSGKFVLTVDIVGDNATYRWEKIDREGETTTEYPPPKKNPLCKQGINHPPPHPELLTKLACNTKF